MITAIIMAAGASKRMKQENIDRSDNYCKISEKNKLLMKIKGKLLIENILNVVNEVDFSERIIIYKDEVIKLKAKEMGFRTIFNDKSEKGMSSSLKLGIINAKPTDAFMFFVADQPLLTKKTIRKLRQGTVLCLGREIRKTIIVPRYNKKLGMPVIFLEKWREELLKVEGDLGGREIIKKNISEVLFVDIENAYEGLDIDTWKDYEVIIKNEYI